MIHTQVVEYNKGARTDKRRQWGIPTGHQTESAKLSLILDQHDPQEWYVELSVRLFDRAVKYGWDEINDCLIYDFDIEGNL